MALFYLNLHIHRKMYMVFLSNLVLECSLKLGINPCLEGQWGKWANLYKAQAHTGSELTFNKQQ